MPPVFGLALLALAALGGVGVCLVPLLWIACSPTLRRRKSAWLWAGSPTFLLFAAGLSCAAYNHRDAGLIEAVDRGDAREVRRLLDGGVSADSRIDPSDPYGSPTVIHRAIDAQRWDIVRVLIDHGATDSYYGDDGLYGQSAVGLLEGAGQKSLARRLKRNGPPHF